MATTCTRASKKLTRYKTKLDAQLALVSIQAKNAKRKKDREEPKRVFSCTFCGGWHLTKQDKEG